MTFNPIARYRVLRPAAMITLAAFLAAVFNTTVLAAQHESLRGEMRAKYLSIPKKEPLQAAFDEIEDELRRLHPDIWYRNDPVYKNTKQRREAFGFKVKADDKVSREKISQSKLTQQKPILDSFLSQARAEFAAQRVDLVKRGAAPELLAHHSDVLAKFETKAAEFERLVNLVLQAPTDAALAESLKNLSGFMAANHSTRHRAFENPDQLPFRAQRNDARKPIESDAGFRTDSSSPFYLGAGAKASAKGRSKLGIVSNPLAPPTADDLAETEDIQLTADIRAKAQELGANPVEIYNWVRNNIEWVPTYGSIQGAEQTLQSGRGNAFDIASLLIALLRANGIHSRYVYGTIEVPADEVRNWVGGVAKTESAQQLLGQGGIPNVGILAGGVISAVRMEHVWVESYVDFYPSRGARHVTGDNWVPLDASRKQYRYTNGFDIATQAPFDASAFDTVYKTKMQTQADAGFTFSADAGAFVTNEFKLQIDRVRSKVAAAQTPLQAKQLVGTKEILQDTKTVLAGTLPKRIVAIANRFTALPDTLRYRFKLLVYANEYDRILESPTINYEASLPRIASRPFFLAYRPASDADAAYLASQPAGTTTLFASNVRLAAQVALDDQVVAEGGVFQLGQELRTVSALYVPGRGWDTDADNTVAAGELQAIGVVGAEVPAKKLQSALDAVARAKSVLQTNPDAPLSFMQGEGMLLYGAIMNYMHMLGVHYRQASLSDVAVVYPLPSFGTISETLTVSYFFGIPRSVTLSGIGYDVDHLRFAVEAKDGQSAKRVKTASYLGAMASFYEHSLLESSFSTNPAAPDVNAVSAVKLLTAAGQVGIPVYEISQANASAILPLLQVDATTLDEMRSALAAGKHVTTSKTALTIDGWTGLGYIIADLDTGSAAYKISGGANGGEIRKTINDILRVVQGIFALKNIQFPKFLGFTNAFSVVTQLNFLLGYVFGLVSIYENCNDVLSAELAILFHTAFFMLLAWLLLAVIFPFGIAFVFLIGAAIAYLYRELLLPAYMGYAGCK